jgi:hypothetical protein
MIYSINKHLGYAKSISDPLSKQRDYWKMLEKSMEKIKKQVGYNTGLLFD